MLLGADQGADRRAGAPGLAVPHCCGWEPRPRAENRLFLEGGQGCSRVLTVGEEPALCSSQASAFVTEARPGVQMEVPEFRYSQTLHVCVRTNTYWGRKLAARPRCAWISRTFRTPRAPVLQAHEEFPAALLSAFGGFRPSLPSLGLGFSMQTMGWLLLPSQSL